MSACPLSCIKFPFYCVGLKNKESETQWLVFLVWFPLYFLTIPEESFNLTNLGIHNLTKQYIFVLVSLSKECDPSCVL